MRTSWYFWAMHESLESLLDLFGNVNGIMPSVICYWWLWTRSPDSLLSLCWCYQQGKKVPPQALWDWFVCGLQTRFPTSLILLLWARKTPPLAFYCHQVGVMTTDFLFIWHGNSSLPRPPGNTDRHKKRLPLPLATSPLSLGVVKLPPWGCWGCKSATLGQMLLPSKGLESRLLV